MICAQKAKKGLNSLLPASCQAVSRCATFYPFSTLNSLLCIYILLQHCITEIDFQTVNMLICGRFRVFAETTFICHTNIARVGNRKGRFKFYLYRAHKEWVVGSVLNSLWGFLQWNLSCLGFLSPFVPRFQSSETQSGGVGRERKEVLCWFMLWHPILRHVALPVCPLAVQIFGQKRVVRQSMKDDDRKTTY